MEAILFCDGRTRCFPEETLPEALLPYCNIPLIARILRFLEQNGITKATLCRADKATRAFVESLPLGMALHWGEPPAQLPARTLVLRRLSLPDWDMGELQALCEAVPVRILHPDGTSGEAELFPAGAAVETPGRTVTAELSVFQRADTPEEYLLLQRRLLERGGMERFRIGQGTKLGKEVRLDEETVVGSDCIIGDHAVLERCCLGDGVQIGANAVLRDCVVCRHALVDRQVRLEGRTVPAGAVLPPEQEQPIFPAVQPCGGDGICRGLPRWNNAGTALQAGAAMTVLGSRIVIGFEAPGGESYALAAAAGAASQGAEVWFAGVCALSQLIYLCGSVRGDSMLWVQGDGVVQLQPRMAGGFPLQPAQNRRLREALAAGVSARIAVPGTLHNAAPILHLWTEECRRLLPERRFHVEISCGNAALREAAQGLFTGGTGEPIVLSLSEDGTRASAFSRESGMVHCEQLLLLSLLSFREQGQALALPTQFHPAAEEFAARYGGRILRLHTPGTSPGAARLWAEQGVCTDGIRLFAHVLRVLARRNLTLAGAAALLPTMFTVKREISTTLSSRAVEHLRRENPDPSVWILCPEPGGLARLLVHAADMETAAELCDFWEQRIHREEARESGA